MLAPDDLTTQKLLLILHRALVEARMLAHAANHQHGYDLADAFEEIPSLMLHWREDGMDEVRARLREYQSKYPHSASDHLAILEMSEADFQARYRPPYPDPVSMASPGHEPGTPCQLPVQGIGEVAGKQRTMNEVE